MKRLSNRTAVVTGGSRGIGLAILKELASEGANIIACSSHRTEERETLYKRIAEENKVSIFPIYFDMADEDSVKEGVKKIKALNLPVDILVNNAGVSHMAILPFTKMTDVHRVFQVNVFSQMLITQNLIGLLSKSEHASIINMSSVAGIDGGVGVCTYGASKAAVALQTKVLAKELSNMKIRVNAIAPGMIDTEMAKQMGDKAVEDMVMSNAAKRIGAPDEVAKCVAFLASDDSSYVNGQTIKIDGGL